jgi:hypothetical protein
MRTHILQPLLASAFVALLSAGSAQAQDPQLIQDKDMIRDKSGQTLRYLYKALHYRVFNDWEEKVRRGLSAADLRLDEVIWIDVDGNPVTVHEAIESILDREIPVLVEAYGDFVVREGIEDWDEIAGGFEDEVQLRIERASGALLSYRNAYVALAEHYEASAERYMQNVDAHESLLSQRRRIPFPFLFRGTSEAEFRHVGGSMAMNDVKSLRDIRRLIAITSGIDGTQAAHELSSLKAAAERSRDSFEAQVSTLDAALTPPSPGPLYDGD